MSDPEPAPDQPVPLEVADQVDRLCDQFEAALRQGRPTTIEEVLAAVPELARIELLRELVALEVEVRRGRGETISFLSYFRRFPDAAPVLEELQREWNLRDSSGFIAIRDPVKLDANVNAETVALPNAPRQMIKQFELLSILGHGGFGTVWRAKDTLLQRDVAVKVPRKDRVMGMNLSLFLREARAAASLRHPNIVAIHEVGEEDSSAFIVSDLVDGVSLKVWLETMRPSTTESAILVAKLATAAHHAHERGIVHRDLKPGNVLIDRRGEPHIADFGLAKRESAEDSLAVGDQLVGTPAYMAPEQARGDHKGIDCRTDVYALGAIFYELLTGQRPFSGEMAMLLNQIQHVAPLAPRKVRPDIPRELEAICLKCLAKDPAQRYQSAQDLADDLHRHISGETLLGIPAAMPVRVQKWLRRHRRAVLGALSIGLLAGSLAWFLRPPETPADYRVVHFTTEPSGCEITAIAIDDITGEPDPTKITDAPKVTPVKMRLAPGEYLITAVLPGESRFHEVYRTVPAHWDTLDAKVMKYGYGWTLRPGSGKEIDIRTIIIPGRNITVGMGFVEGKDVEEPALHEGEAPKRWHVPAFLVDPHEFLQPIYGSAMKNAKPVGRMPLVVQYGATLSQNLENAGRRCPSAAELYVLSSVVCPASAKSTQDTDPDGSACVLPDPGNTRLEDVHSGRWEWTSTRPGGPFSGMSYSPTIGDLLSKRMIGCGASAGLESSSVTKTGLRWESESETGVGRIGVRGVRSDKPRRKPEDFVRPVKP